jgi:hypothetical protein
MAEPTTPDAPFALEASALRIGRYRWVEMRLFEALGGWVTGVPELDAKALLATHSRHHGWHAELWHDLLPELPVLPTTDGGHPGAGISIDDWAPPPSDEQLAAFAAALTEPRAPGLTVEKLVGVYRVALPQTIAAYTRHLRAASPVADEPTIRALRLVLSDELDHWRDGEMLVQSLVVEPGMLDRAAAHQVRLEKLLLAAGGIAGRPPDGA